MVNNRTFDYIIYYNIDELKQRGKTELLISRYSIGKSALDENKSYKAVMILDNSENKFTVKKITDLDDNFLKIKVFPEIENQIKDPLNEYEIRSNYKKIIRMNKNIIYIDFVKK